MRFLSLFSGMEAASVAWLPLGWECAAVAEIEPFPCKLLAYHYPDVINLGDITKITKEQIESLGHIDLVVGGFPCQDLSVAGKRKGLKNADGSATRSGLFYTALQISRWTNARWLLLENVPGIYSSNNGRDFASMAGEILNTEFAVPKNGWQNSGVACSGTGLLEWRTLDAQHFGVPQRRRRMFALADFGNWVSREPVLFERDSLQGHSAPSRGERKEVTEIAGTLTSNGGGLNRPAGNANKLDFCVTVETAKTLITKTRLDSETETFIPCFALAGNTIGRQPENGGNGTGYDDSGVSYTLTKTDQHAVAYGVGESPDLAHCLRSGASKADKHESTTYIQQSMQVRRLTPMECERLQGFPDSYTNIPGASDSARYKALGNSFAVPVVRWLGERIQYVEGLSNGKN
jgi:DNA (cytosine-5)-methyltransferase 1